MMIYGLLVALGIPDLCKSIDGWPDYASAMAFEFYSNPSSDEHFFKILYRDNSDSDMEDVTSLISVCNGAQFCSLENLKNIAKYFKPEPDYHTVSGLLFFFWKKLSIDFFSSAKPPWTRQNLRFLNFQQIFWFSILWSLF